GLVLILPGADVEGSRDGQGLRVPGRRLLRDGRNPRSVPRRCLAPGGRRGRRTGYRGDRRHGSPDVIGFFARAFCPGPVPRRSPVPLPGPRPIERRRSLPGTAGRPDCAMIRMPARETRTIITNGCWFQGQILIEVRLAQASFRPPHRYASSPAPTRLAAP